MEDNRSLSSNEEAKNRRERKLPRQPGPVDQALPHSNPGDPDSPETAVPPGADPHWQKLYQSIRQAVLDLRPRDDRE